MNTYLSIDARHLAKIAELEKLNAELVAALKVALPIIDDAAQDASLKPSDRYAAVARLFQQQAIDARAALAKAEGRE